MADLILVNGEKNAKFTKINSLQNYLLYGMLSRHSTYLHTILQHFWTQWRREYLLELRESHRRSQGHGTIKISIGDVVIIHDDTPRGMWRLGLVEKLQGRDGECRGAIVRVKSGQGPSSFMRRPLQRLFPLEVHQQDNTEGVLVRLKGSLYWKHSTYRREFYGTRECSVYGAIY